MLSPLRLSVAASVALFALSSVACNEDGAAEAVRDEARAAVTSAEPVAPVATDAAPAEPTGPTTEMTFAETEYDFGTVTEGEKVTHTYSFTNTGDEPLILSNARGSCGCTVPEWPRTPIAPGGTGEVTVVFNSRGKGGDRNQRVTLTANTEPTQTFLSLKGTVEKAEADPLVQ